MKNLVYLITASVLLLACEQSMVEPVYEDPADSEKQIQISNELNDDNLAPKKNYRKVSFAGEYTFDPDNQNGGFVGKHTPKYAYENNTERSLRNLRIYSPGELTIAEKTYKVVNVYTINRYERLSKKGIVVSGKTWGHFEIYLKKKPEIKEDEIPVRFSTTNTASLDKDKLGNIIFNGQFSGTITGGKVTVALVGNGQNEMKGSRMTGKELMNCGNRFCYKSKSSGKLVHVELKDE